MSPFHSYNHLPPHYSTTYENHSFVLNFYNFVISRMLYRPNHADVTFWDWLFSLNKILWRFIQIVACISTTPFSLLSSCPQYGCHTVCFFGPLVLWSFGEGLLSFKGKHLLWTPNMCFFSFPLILSHSDIHYPQLVQTPQVKVSFPQDCPLLQMPITSLGLPHFWTTDYKLRVPITLSSGLMVCSNGSQNSWKHLCLLIYYEVFYKGLPWWLRQWRICLQCRRPRFDPWVGKIPWRREWQPTHSSIISWRIPWIEEPGELQSMGCKESDVTGWLTF